MRIMYIHQHFSLPTGGGGGRPYQFAKRMAAEGHEVTMVCAGHKPLDEVVDGFRIVRFAVPYRNSMGFSQRVKSFFHFMIKASIFSVKNSTDVVFASSTPLTAAIPGLVAKYRHRVPFVFEVRDLWPKIPIEMGFLTNPVLVWMARKLEYVTYKHADHVIALSPGMRDGVIEVTPQTPVTIVPNASDIEVFDKSDEERKSFREAQGWTDDTKVIAYAGGFGTVYSLEWIVNLAAEMQDQPVKFIMMGEGSQSDKLRELAMARGLNPDDLFLGRTPRAVVAEHIAASDIVVSSMRLDRCLEAASLNKVFDGLAAGKPIIVNHAGWLSDLIVEEMAGWKLDRNPKIAAEELKVILDNPEGINIAALNSRQLARIQFDRNILYRRLMEVFREVNLPS